MFFTQEDIQKISKGLAELSIKDTQLPGTEEVLEQDCLAIVQDGKNKKVSVRDFLNNLGVLKKSDFINISALTDNTYNNIDEVVHEVPVNCRKPGLCVTFQDTDYNWKIYQFRGEANQWDVLTFWVDILDYSSYVVNGILPDEEDLTVSGKDEKDNLLLSLKDRKPSEDFVGKGYKILRRNIVKKQVTKTGILINKAATTTGTVGITISGITTMITLTTSDNTVEAVAKTIYDALIDNEKMSGFYITYESNTVFVENKFTLNSSISTVGKTSSGAEIYVNDEDIEVDKNILTQAAINQPNTIYEIRYDFDLYGAEIVIPEDCVLKFEGGSFKNGTLTGQLLNEFLCPEWLGAIGNGINDDTAPIENSTKICTKVLLKSSKYKVKTLNFSDYTCLIGNKNTILYYNALFAKDNFITKNIIFDGRWDCTGIQLQNNALVDNCTFLNTRNSTYQDSGITKCISVGNYYTRKNKQEFKNITISNCIFDGCTPRVQNPSSYSENYNPDEQGNDYCCQYISLFGATNVSIKNNIFKNMDSIYEADMIRIHNFDENNLKFPYAGNNDAWDGENPTYLNINYLNSTINIKNNTFIVGAIKSAIKIMAGGIYITDNYFRIDSTNNIRKIYALIRSYYNEGTVIQSNTIYLNSTNISKIFEFQNTENNVVKNNAITAAGTNIPSNGAFLNCSYNKNLEIKNNYSSTFNFPKIFTGECNGIVIIENNTFYNTYNAGQKNISTYEEYFSHYSYPDKNTLGNIIIKGNTFFIEGNALEAYSIGIRRENSLIIAKNTFTFINCSPEFNIDLCEGIQDKSDTKFIVDNNISNIAINIKNTCLQAFKLYATEVKINNNYIDSIYSTNCATLTCENNNFLATKNSLLELIEVDRVVFKGNLSSSQKTFAILQNENSCIFNIENNKCMSLSIYLRKGTISKNSTYIPSYGFKVINYDRGTSNSRDLLSSNFKLENGFIFSVTDEVFGEKDYKAINYSNGTIGWLEANSFKGYNKDRPTSATEGTLYWDMTNKKPIWKKEDTNIWINADSSDIDSNAHYIIL